MFSDASEGFFSLILCITNGNGSEDFFSLCTLAHETAHALQSVEAHLLYAEPFFRHIVEGYQWHQEKQIILSLAAQESPLGKKVQQIIHQGYQTALWRPRIWAAILERITPLEEKEVSLEKKLDFLLMGPESSIALSGYDANRIFVDTLSRIIGIEPIQTLHQNGNFDELKNRLGEDKFRALIIFFRTWDEIKAPSPRRDGLRSAGIYLAGEILLQQGQFPLDWPERLSRCTGNLFDRVDRLMLHGQKIRLSVWTERVRGIILDYLQGFIDFDRLNAMLDNRYTEMLLELGKEEGNAPEDGLDMPGTFRLEESL